MASAEPSSTRRVRRVKTERTRKIIIRALIIRKMARPRRIVIVVVVAAAVTAAPLRAFIAGQGNMEEIGCRREDIVQSEGGLEMVSLGRDDPEGLRSFPSGVTSRLHQGGNVNE